MVNAAHIVEGWSKRLGIRPISPEEAKMAEERLKICLECPLAKKSKILVLIKGKANREQILKCSGCGCPIYEKAIVPDEKCPQGKWKRREDLL